MNPFPSNALAGPSSPRTDHPTLFLPPQGPPPPRQHLASTQDLLSRFHLLPAYDKYVRPFATQYTHDGQIRSTPAPSSTLDKGKGKEVDSGMPLSQAQTQGAPGTAGVGVADGEDDDATGGKGEKKKKNSYKALIKGIPGKHSMKKDDYLTSMMMIPPKQPTRINQFDVRTQQEAFAVSLEGLKGWNVTTLILESAQAREDRKKRKELKRLAKAQQAQAAAALQAGAATSPVVVQPQPIPAGAGGVPRRGASATPQIPVISSTPKPVGTPRPISTVPRPGSTIPRPGSAVPRPGSTVPRPGSTAPSNVKQEQRPIVPPVQMPGPMAMVATPSRTATTTPMSVDLSRGKKRDREDGAAMGTPVNGVPPVADAYVNGMSVNGIGNGNGMTKVNAKAGSAGVRPRPAKKQRMDMQGQARDVSAPVQQPTPQGV